MNAFGYTALTANREGKLFRSDGIDIDPPTTAIESDVAINERVNRVIAAETDVLAGLKFCAALPDNDITRDDHLASEFLYSETFADAVAAVLNAALSFFVCHGLRFFRFGAAGDAFDFHAGEFATMADRAVIAFAASVLKRDDLFILALLNDFARDLAAIRDLTAVDVHQHFEGGRFTRLDVKEIDIYRIAFRDSILPAASLDNCVGHNVFPGRKSREKSHRSCGLATPEIVWFFDPEMRKTISPFGGWAS